MGKIADALRGTALPEQNRKKLLTLDQEFVGMEAEIQTLKSKNMHLQAQVNPLEREVEGLKNQIKQNATRRHDRVHPQAEEEILLLLLQGPMEEKNVIQAIGKGREPTLLNLVELASAGLIKHESEFSLPTLCSLTQDGRLYLKEKMKRAEFAGDVSEYTESDGAFFKRLPSGGYSDTPYCPKCRSAMFSLAGPLPFTCGNQACKQEAGFSKRDLPRVMSNLPQLTR